MSRLGDLLEINNLRLVFGAGNLATDVLHEVREDAAFARAVLRGLTPIGRRDHPPVVDPFPPFHRRAAPAMRGQRVAVVLSGGSGATAAACGLARALEEADVEAAAISACSGSMLFASLWAAGLSADAMARFWLSVPAHAYIDPDWSALVRAGLRRLRGFTGLLRGEAIERLYRERFGGLTLGELPIALHAVVWNIDENRVEYLGPRTTPDLPLATAVRVAISLPILVAPVKIGGHLYGDGGIVDILPVRPLLDAQPPFDRVFGLNCYHPEGFQGEDIGRWDEKPWSVFRASLQLRYIEHLEIARGQVRALGDRLVLLDPVPYDEVRGARFYQQFLDRSEWARFMRQGYDAARAALDRMEAQAAQGVRARGGGRH